jgi:hypothetical protein
MIGTKALPLLLTLALSGCVRGPEVSQGIVTEIDVAGKQVVIRDNGGEEHRYEIARAELGGEPQAGDEVRIAWREVEGKRVALRIMDVGHQEESSGGH